MYRLFDAFAHRYDLHTPPGHYQHDHQLVLDLAREHGQGCRILDVGCGTGVLVAKALAAGFDAHGLDASAAIVSVARTRVPHDAVRVQRMQDIDEREQYDVVVALSWSIHYCADANEMENVLVRIHSALKPGGRVLLQVAHGPNLPDGWSEDHELSPGGTSDVFLRYQFRADPMRIGGVLADYGYRCASLGEAFEETHALTMADLGEVTRCLQHAGFAPVESWNSWKRDPFVDAGSAFLCARCA
jgi:SAM-dependent methyltransferase